MNARYLVSEQNMFDFLSYLVTSARLCLDEPEHYPILRLIDGARRLIHMVIDMDELEERTSLEDVLHKLDMSMTYAETDSDVLSETLDEIILILTRREMKNLGENG
jgi:hypothetical protein